MGSNETPFSQEPKKRLRKEAQATEDVAYKPLIDEKESPVVCDEELIKEEKVSFIVLNGERDVAREVEDKELMLRKWLASSSSAPLVDDEIDDEVCCMSNVKITGTCFCKIFVVLYLLACLLVSALYIAIYGPNELYLMPETPPPYKPSKPALHLPPVRFYDNPYTEWISQRWTYGPEQFADWPKLPERVGTIRQVVGGHVDGQEGVWLLDSTSLYFVLGFGSSSPENVQFLNMSDNLDLNITNNTYLTLLDKEKLYLISPYEVVLLNCSQSSTEDCDISQYWSVDYINASNAIITSTVLSTNDRVLWIGTDGGLFALNTSSTHLSEDNETAVVPVLDIDEPVISLAWRAGLGGVYHGRGSGRDYCGRGFKSKTFWLSPSSSYQCLDISYNGGGGAYKGTGDGCGFGLLVIGTNEKLYFYDGNRVWFEWISRWEGGLGGVVDGPPSSLTFVPSGDLYIGNNISLSRLFVNYTFQRLGPREGLPYRNILTLHYLPLVILNPPLLRPLILPGVKSCGGTLLVGTGKGYSLFDVGSSRFVGYHYGPRWLPGDGVSGASSLYGDVFVIVSDGGIAVLRGEEWTLERKAGHYQDMLSRHTREPGLTANCPLDNYTVSTCEPVPTDNDGLWTSWSVAAEALRYKATGIEEAKRNAWSLYRGMKFLVEVTGVSGLPARSVVRDDDNQTGSIGDDWHASVTNPGWLWKGDTSSDEIAGHIFAYNFMYDLVAASLKEKMNVASTLDSIMSYIKSNNYTLVDVTNHTTRWGVWSPDQLNYNQSWADERGLNSLEMLSGLMSAYRMTMKKYYIEAWQELVDTHGYGLNMINQKITFPRDFNFSDDELAFMQYFVYFHTLKELSHQQDKQFPLEDAMSLGQLSLKQAWDSVKREKSSAWTSIYSFATGQNNTEILEKLVWSLREWPLDLVQWPTTNSHRLDIHLDPEQDRYYHSGIQSVRVLPPNERTQLRWNSNPFQLDSEGSSNEMDPAPWLLPYWLARWIKLL